MKRIFHIVILLFIIPFAQAQNNEIKDVKVGLVLSGGGAKGFAHIGALRVIEEAGVS